MDQSVILQQATELIQSCSSPLPSLANLSALLWQSMERINWAGFYLFDGQQLILGPFQGKPACTTIPLHRGVCGTAAAQQRAILVPNVHLFEGHIACDGDSKSEIVIPLILDGQLLGVLDIDSPDYDRFKDQDLQLLTSFVEVLLDQIDWHSKKIL